MSKELRNQIDRLRLELDIAQKNRRKDRLQLNRDIEVNAERPNQLKAYSASPDIANLLAEMRWIALHDIEGYSKTPSLLEPQPSAMHSPFTDAIRGELTDWLTLPDETINVAGLIPQAARLRLIFEKEINELASGNSTQHTMTAVMMPKLKLVQHAMHDKRYNDCLTILKTMQRSDPHNPLVVFLLGQILYYMTGQGQQGALPEARDFAQRSTIFSDRISIEKLWYYRYHAIACERLYDPDRALVWLKETGMLDPHLIGDNWGRMQGAGMKGWALLSTIPIKHWGEDEVSTLLKLVDDTPGGALLYLAWFRPALLEDAASRKTPLPGIEELEKKVQTAWSLYQIAGQPLKELVKHPPRTFWTVRNRYLAVIGGLVPPPEFDHVLLHVALNGEAWRTSYPDHETRVALEDSTSSYWRLWCVSVTPIRELRQNHLLPAQECLEDYAILSRLEEALSQLQAEENKLIQQATWEDLQPWMVRWSMDHLLAAGSGSNKPRLRFAPTLPPYSLLYHVWSEPAPRHVLASHMIMENAQRGGFASMFEALAAFDGAYRLLEDPVHGLIAAQRRALQAARKQNPDKYSGIKFEGASGGKAALFMLPIVVIILIVIIFTYTSNIGQAVGLILALGGMCGVVAVRLAR